MVPRPLLSSRIASRRPIYHYTHGPGTARRISSENTEGPGARVAAASVSAHSGVGHGEVRFPAKPSLDFSPRTSISPVSPKFPVILWRKPGESLHMRQIPASRLIWHTRATPRTSLYRRTPVSVPSSRPKTLTALGGPGLSQSKRQTRRAPSTSHSNLELPFTAEGNAG